MEALRERFVVHMLGGLKVDDAIRGALQDSAAAAHAGLLAGTPFDAIVRVLGLRSLVDQGVEKLWEFAVTDWVQSSLSVIPGPVRIGDVPRPDCVEAHLPKDREPTGDDYRRAWDFCIGQTR